MGAGRVGSCRRHGEDLDNGKLSRGDTLCVMKRSLLLDGEWIVGTKSRSRGATEEALADGLDRGSGKEEPRMTPGLVA